ncbi:MAG TPA: hypothetical protein VFS10_00190 [Pyrinomonadaceae bacterium]|nr:hypothetical protein [Pyrinomonadaceae bacterium]
MRNSVRVWLAVFVLASLSSPAARAQVSAAEQGQTEAARLELILARVGERVEQYLGGMFSLSFKEVLRREVLKEDLTPKGKSKEYVFDNVVLREQRAGDGREFYGRALRRLRTVDGKPVKPSKQKEELSKCGAPRASYADPLTFLLPKLQAQQVFTYEAEEVLRGRRVHRLGHVRREPVKPGTRSEDGCLYAWGEYKGTVWVDAENFDVLQTSTRLAGEFDFESPPLFTAGFARFGPKRKMRFERSEHTTRFSRVRFREPEQELLLPESSETLNVIRNGREPRVRHTQSFEDYRRFVSDVKIIEDDEPEN